MIEQVVLAHDPIAIFQQIKQEIEHLRLDRHALPTAAQLLPAGVKYMI